jgi:HSP20 family protein
MRYGLTSRPADAFQNLRRLNSFLDEAIGGFPFGSESATLTAAWTPAVDVFEDKDAVKIVAELPGVKAEDVKISLESQTLTLRGEKRQVAEEKTERVHRYERTYGAFERTFALPGTVDADRIEASYADGLLTVTLPKVERARPRQIDIRTK